MGGLTTKQRFIFIFSLYVFSFLVVSHVVFLLIFNYASASQVKRNIEIESKEIIANHLLLNKNSLSFYKDQSGISLREHLINFNISALFLDSKKQVLRAYGVFVLGNAAEKESLTSLLMNLLTDKKQNADATIIWQDKQFAVSIITLRNNRNTVGYMAIGKSLEEFDSFKKMMFLVFISLGILGLCGSFMVGYFISERAFSPLNKMIKVIEKIELDKLGSLLLVEGNPRDEITRLSEQFNKMLGRLREMAGRQKAFISNISHELRTPLTRAISSLDVLPLSFKRKKDLIVIRNDLFTVDALLEKLLLLTRLKKDIHVGKPYLLNVLDLSQTLQKKFAEDLRRKKLSFNRNIQENLELRIPYEYLLMILSNLIMNAIKYSDSQKNIFLTGKKSRGQAIIAVEDEGLGMTRQEIKHMFDRFYQGKENKGEGYGIGLSLVKQICDLYGVKIEVISAKKKGTSVSLRFPKIP